MPSLTSNQVLDLFRRVGALLEGHFKLSSGLHSPGYLQSALVLQHPREAETLGAALADAARPLEPDVVLSPALGGIVIGQEVARALGVPAIFAERQDGALTLRRGFTPGAGRPCARGRGRGDDRRIDARDDRRGHARRRRRRGGRRRSSIAAAATRGCRSRTRRWRSVAFPTYQPDACPLCAAGRRRSNRAPARRIARLARRAALPPSRGRSSCALSS